MQAGIMKVLYDEIIKRFPEVIPHIAEEDEESPYMMMRCIVEWLEGMNPKALTPDVVKRIQSFTGWCEAQPRGKIAADDMLTILVVGFYEKLFNEEHTRALLPELMTKEELVQNSDYLKHWVGENNYESVLKLYH